MIHDFEFEVRVVGFGREQDLYVRLFIRLEGVVVYDKVCVTSSVCEAQITRRHNGLQSVCFSEVRRHKNVCARSSPHRYEIATSKVCNAFALKKTLFFWIPPPFVVQPPSLTQKKPRRLHLAAKRRTSSSIAALLSDQNRRSQTSSPIQRPPIAAASEQRRLREGHPKAASLRAIPLPFPDLCARLFDGNSATGNFRSYSTQSSSVAGASSCRVPPLQITATPFDAMDDDGVDTSHHEPPPSAASPSAASPYTATPSGNPNKRAKPSTPVAPSASLSASSPDGTSITADDLAFEMKKALQSLTKGYTIPQCLEKLEVLQLSPTDPLRFVAYHIFGGTMNMIEMWMHLPDVPEILRGWLEMMSTNLGVLKDGKIVR
ncbi:unnamed protein product [Lactuca saligna]|uniref:Uncharacterized protein n=1 Tax=Lactuca saligna TaxID=75948 RepID=A0AA35ZF84_LACSI|nr:unnamed protein product [Lactuca saligna]